jgi:glucose/arabinose dehydrogenase
MSQSHIQSAARGIKSDLEEREDKRIQMSQATTTMEEVWDTGASTDAMTDDRVKSAIEAARSGEDVPTLRNRYVVGGLISQSVWSVTLTPPGHDLPPLDGGTRYDAAWTHDAYTATAHRLLEDELGRVRHVAQSPSGELYAITSNRDGRAKGRFPREKDDVLVRLTTA